MDHREPTMRIVILSHKGVASRYAGTLAQRGHEAYTLVSGALNAAALKFYLDCDGCLLLGDEPDLLVIANHMKASGKKIWRELTDIPPAKRRTEKARAETRSVDCVAVAPAPARRLWVILEYGNGTAEIESTHDTYTDAIKRAAELAAKHKVHWVRR
jgi:hypothetical protein